MPGHHACQRTPQSRAKTEETEAPGVRTDSNFAWENRGNCGADRIAIKERAILDAERTTTTLCETIKAEIGKFADSPHSREAEILGVKEMRDWIGEIGIVLARLGICWMQR
jgi:hypothetical protein